jgi:hypothetical protein
LAEQDWHDVGEVAALKNKALHEVMVGRTRPAFNWTAPRHTIEASSANAT